MFVRGVLISSLRTGSSIKNLDPHGASVCAIVCEGFAVRCVRAEPGDSVCLDLESPSCWMQRERQKQCVVVA